MRNLNKFILFIHNWTHTESLVRVQKNLVMLPLGRPHWLLSNRDVKETFLTKHILYTLLHFVPCACVIEKGRVGRKKERGWEGREGKTEKGEGEEEERRGWRRKGKFSSVTQSCLTLCNPMNRSTPSLPVHHQLREFTQTHVQWVSDAIQPFHPLSSPSPPTFNLSKHQGLFQWVNTLHEVASSSHHVAKVLEFQLQHQSFQWTLRTDLL